MASCGNTGISFTTKKKVCYMGYSQLTENQRYQIYALKKVGHKQNQIATLIMANKSTISREIKRNTGLR